MIRQTWQVVDGDVRVAVDEAEWWGASLAVLIAAIHHPGTLAARQPATDPADVARQMIAEVVELYAAAAVADAQVQDAGATDWPGIASVRRDGAEVVFAPGGEVANLAWCIEVFATAALDRSSPDATVARGATAYAASAWSTAVGMASGTLGGTEESGGRTATRRTSAKAVDAGETGRGEARR